MSNSNAISDYELGTALWDTDFDVDLPSTVAIWIMYGIRSSNGNHSDADANEINMNRQTRQTADK